MVSYEFLWIRRACDYIQLNAHYCVLFSSRVTVRVRIRFGVWLHAHDVFTLPCVVTVTLQFIYIAPIRSVPLMPSVHRVLPEGWVFSRRPKLVMLKSGSRGSFAQRVPDCRTNCGKSVLLVSIHFTTFERLTFFVLILISKRNLITGYRVIGAYLEQRGISLYITDPFPKSKGKGIYTMSQAAYRSCSGAFMSQTERAYRS